MLSYGKDRRTPLLVATVAIVSVTPLLSNPIKLVVFVLAILLIKSAFPQRATYLGWLGLIVGALALGACNDLFSPDLSSLDPLGLHVFFIAGIALGFVAASAIPYDDFMDTIGLLVPILALLSLAGVVVYTLFPEMVAAFPTYRYSETVHHTAYFTNFLVHDNGSVVKRNAGIASEPGLYQLLLNLAVVSVARAKDLGLRAWLRLAVLALALYTTRSTAGLLIFGILILIIAFRSPKRFILISLVGLSGIGAVIAREIQYQREQKWFGSHSFQSRLEPAQAVLESVLAHPFGVGTEAYNRQYLSMNWGSFDSFTQVLIRYGLPLSIVLLILLVKLTLRRPAVGVIILGTLMSQPVWYVPLVAYLFFSPIYYVRASFHPRLASRSVTSLQ